MPYISPEVVEQARQIDLLTYLQSCEPQELVRISGNNYTTRTHDSLKISNGKWMWWSQRIGGCNALDYLVKGKGCSFVEAVETLMGKAAVMPSVAFCRSPVAASILASTAASCAFSTAMLAAMPSADSASPAFALLFSTFAWATMAAASSFAFSMCAVA